MSESQITPAKPHSSTRAIVLFAALAVGILAFLGLFHIVQSPDGIRVIPKDHFSYSLTFTSVDDVVRRSNASRRDDPPVNHLVEGLRDRGEIVHRTSPEDEATERELARIWKETQDQGVVLAPYARDIVRKYYPNSR